MNRQSDERCISADDAREIDLSVHRRPVILSLAAALAALSLLAAGCGGGRSPRVANVGTTSTVTTSIQNRLVAYTQCMRSNGVRTFPEPNGKVFPKLNSQKLGVSGSQFQAAMNACSYLLPNGGGQRQTISPADQTDYLKAAKCVRSHGFPAFPDPTFQGSTHVTFSIPSNIDQHSLAFQRAVATCQKLIPPGLPYARSGGP